MLQIWSKTIKVLIVCLCICFYWSTSSVAESSKISFNIPSQNVKSALNLFVKVTDLSLISSVEESDNIITQTVLGDYTPDQALSIMLEQTGLIYERRSEDTISIKVKKPEVQNSVSQSAELSSNNKVNNPDSQAVDNTASSSDGDYTLEDTVVTATKTGETRLQQTPIAITAFSEEALKTRGTFNLMELGSPNLQVMSGSNEQMYYIRGIGNDSNSYLQEPNVGIYIDGVYMEKGFGGMADFMDVERIEVLRGPQGTSYGRNSTGGAINILTAPPTEDFYAKVITEYASFDKLRFDATISGPIVKDKLNARLTAMSNQWDGHYNIIGKPDDQDNQSIMVKGALDFKISDTINFILRGDYEDTENRTPMFEKWLNDEVYTTAPFTTWYPGYGYTQAPDGFYNILAATPKSYYKKENSGLSGHFTINLPFEATLRSITAYRDFYREILANDAFGMYSPSLQEDQVNTFSQELQVDGSVGNLGYIIGAFYYRMREDLDTDQNVPFPPGSVFLDADIGTDAYALFSELSYSLTDKLTLRGGLRYSYEEKTTDSLRAGFMGALTQVNLEGDWDAYTPKVSAEYRISEDAMIYGSVATGYRAGTFALVNQPPAPLEIEPETNVSYEVGFKSEWLDKRLRFNVSAFLSQYEDQQVTGTFTAPTGAITIGTFNAAGSEIKGVELEMLARPLPALTLNLSAGYMDAAFTEYDTFDTANNPVSYSGNQLAFSPKGQMNFGAQYIFDLQNLGFITLRGDVSWKDKIYYNHANDERLAVDSLTLVNAFVRYETADSSFSVELYCKNLTDEEYYTRKADYWLDAYTANLGLPRTFGARVSYSF